jgi:hypothetical protein
VLVVSGLVWAYAEQESNAAARAPARMKWAMHIEISSIGYFLG